MPGIVVNRRHAQSAVAADQQARQQRTAHTGLAQTVRPVGAKLHLIALELLADVGRDPIGRKHGLTDVNNCQTFTMAAILLLGHARERPWHEIPVCHHRLSRDGHPLGERKGRGTADPPISGAVAAPRAPWCCRVPCPSPKSAGSSPSPLPKSTTFSTTIAIKRSPISRTIGVCAPGKASRSSERRSVSSAKATASQATINASAGEVRSPHRNLPSDFTSRTRPSVSGGRHGLIKNCYADSRVSGLWEIPAGYTIAKASARLVLVIINQTNEVQYGTDTLQRCLISGCSR
jgi:hypothetical protein